MRFWCIVTARFLTGRASTGGQSDIVTTTRGRLYPDHTPTRGRPLAIYPRPLRIVWQALAIDLRHVGQAFVSIGDIRLRTGDLAGAEEAFTRAEERDVSPLPGRARLELLRGRPAEAAVLMKAVLEGENWDRLARTWLLPDQVTIALAVGDLDTARSAAAELAESAQTYGSKAMHAAAEGARGAIALATGEDDPMPSLRRSVTLWREAGSPYETARARVVLATAMERAGQLDSARVELADALACFDQLGARLDADAVADWLSTARDRASS